mmetsp:Transcript_57770/g.162966  ORF Transcript_57770/g.162966 Transcript_57770/m.162966 type:complete len:204 (-) Transcript_57770:667-1278(-)
MLLRRISRAWAHSPWDTVSGGTRRSVSKMPVVSTMSPRDRHAFATSLAKPLPTDCSSKSTPIMRPGPRTQLMRVDASCCSSARPAVSWRPRSRTFARMSSSSMTSIVAHAAAQATALPAYVPPWLPPGCMSISGLRDAIPASGSPVATPFAKTRMSGCTPSCSTANILPVRPKPLWTSSAMSRSPCASQMARMPARRPGGCVT